MVEAETVTPDAMTARFEGVSDAGDPAATVSTLRIFLFENDRPGFQA